MLYLHVSNRTENLLRHLAAVLESCGRQSPFAREMFLIQSQGMERMISQGLAAEFTSWCNFQYFLPLGFLQYVARQMDLEMAPDGFDRRTMSWRLEGLLREIDGEPFLPLLHYLQGDDASLKRFQLAEQLANIFDQYQLMRPEMLAAWDEGRLVTGESHERWQQRLWLRLRQQQPQARHRGEVLRTIISRLQTGSELAGVLPQRVSVFGLSIMPPLFLSCLQALGNHCDVHLYVLSPCREYWGDLELRRRQLEAGAQAASNTLDHPPERHPLLVALGRQGRDFQRMLFGDQIRFTMEFSSYHDPGDHPASSLLHRLQSDLLRGDVRRCAEPWPADDESIRVVSCHSRLRELTILKDHVLQWLYADPTLQLRDIVVMAPDIQEYAALIPAVFDSIQHSIADRSLRRRNPVLAAFVAFLSLYRGRFAWSEMFDVISEPVVAAGLELTVADLDLLKRWITEAGIRWGLSAAQRRESGLADFAETSWQAGLERLLMGCAIDSEEFIGAILPHRGPEGSGAAPLGGLCHFVDLVTRARKELEVARPLGSWSTLLTSLAGQLFGTTGEYGRDLLELQEILAELSEGPASFHQYPVEFRVIAAWLERTARETRSSSGFLRGQLTFCSMLPMRSIPFAKVCLIGLNDGAFPREDRYAAFDLMGASHRPGDRSRRTDDRYQFLEAIMAAREQLYLSYLGQSIKNNEPLMPAVVVSELLEVLQDCYRAGDLLVRHPLHPFSRRYFSGEEPALFSHDAQFCEVAGAMAGTPRERIAWWQGRRDAEVRDVAVRALLTFARNPQRWFVRDCLGIRLDSDEAVTPESEPFVQAGLERYQVNQMLLDTLLTGRDPELLCRRLQAMGRWPLGEPGRLEFAARTEELRSFADQAATLGLGVRQDDLEVELEIDGYRLAGMLGNRYEGGYLLCRYARRSAGDLLTGYLYWLLHFRQTGHQAEVVVMRQDELLRFPRGGEAVPDLAAMLALFVEGCREPSPLYLNPAMEYLERIIKGKDPEMALAAAVRRLAGDLNRGHDRETALLLCSIDPATVLDDRFLEVSHRLFEPILRRAYGD